MADSPQTQVNFLNYNYRLMLRWVRLAETLRSGEPVREQATPEIDPEEAMRNFICAMADLSRASSQEVAAKLDLVGCGRVTSASST